MSRPLADAAGNALEVAYAIDYLTGARREPRMHEVTLSLCTEMLLLGKLARTAKSARAMLQQALDSGAAAEIFQRMISALGGPKTLVADPWKHLPKAPLTVGVYADCAGVITKVDTRAVGLAVVALGGGRTRPQDPVDHAVGLTSLVGTGDAVDGVRPLALVHARTQASADQAAAMVRAAYRVGAKAPAAVAPVLERLVAQR